MASAAIGSHGVLDMTTDGGMGVGLLMPFRPDRVFFSFRPIEVSPISPRRFLTDGAPFLASEFIWVWIPIMVLFASVWIWRKQRTADPIESSSDIWIVTPLNASGRQIAFPTFKGTEAGSEEPRLQP